MHDPSARECTRLELWWRGVMLGDVYGLTLDSDLETLKGADVDLSFKIDVLRDTPAWGKLLELHRLVVKDRPEELEPSFTKAFKKFKLEVERRVRASCELRRGTAVPEEHVGTMAVLDRLEGARLAGRQFTTWWVEIVDSQSSIVQVAIDGTTLGTDDLREWLGK